MFTNKRFKCKYFWHNAFLWLIVIHFGALFQIAEAFKVTVSLNSIPLFLILSKQKKKKKRKYWQTLIKKKQICIAMVKNKQNPTNNTATAATAQHHQQLI